MILTSFDLETYGLDGGLALCPFSDRSDISFLSVYTDNKNYYCSQLCPSSDDICKALSGLPKTTILCAWNLVFDIAFCIKKAPALYDVFSNYKLLDGRLLLRRLQANLKSYALKKVLKEYNEHINFSVKYSDDYGSAIQFKTGHPSEQYSKDELKKLRNYNLRDAIYTKDLCSFLMQKASKRQIKQALKESYISLYFAKSWVSGVSLCVDTIKSLQEQSNQYIKALEMELEKYDLDKDTIASNKKMINYLVTNSYDLGSTYTTEKGSISVNKKSLEFLKQNSDGDKSSALSKILALKEKVTEKNKFIDAASECIALYKDKCFAQPLLAATYTGRMTYTTHANYSEIKILKSGKSIGVKHRLRVGLPLHQLKRGDLRSIFKAKEGYKLVEFDFCAQEMRLLACLADEHEMITKFRHNQDLHAYTASKIFGYDYDEFLDLEKNDSKEYKDMRFVGKITNLSLQYRQSAKAMHDGWQYIYKLDKSLQDAEHARAVYLNLYYGVQQYWQKNIMLARRDNKIVSKAGRVFYFTDWLMREFSYEQTAVNFPIQSLGADQKILGLYCLKDILCGDCVEFGWDLHDGLYFYMREDSLAVLSDVKNVLENLPYEKAWGWKPQIKFPVECKIGSSWGDLKEININ